jgi:type IV pilus assembly protein PilB
MEVERYLLGAALSGIISQKLARRLCTKCRGARKTTDYEKNVFKRALNLDINEIYQPVGCDECHGGYKGRIAIHEVLLITQEIKDAIVSNLPKSEIRKLVYGSGTITMLQDGLTKVVAGETTFEEILKLIDLEDDLGKDTNLGLKETLKNSETSNNSNHNMIDTL